MMPIWCRNARAILMAVSGLIGVTAIFGMSFDRKAGGRAGPMEWGLYQILWSRDYGEHLAREVARFASKPHYVMFYRDLPRPFPKLAIDAIHEQRATAIVSLELWSWHGGRRGSFLPVINTGEYDAQFRQWALDAKADGRRVMLRFGFEFNGDWFTWSGDPQAFVSAWRRARDIFREVGADNVEWLWSPNVVNCPDKVENDMHRYYPGSEYVDWVGVDGYNFGDDYDQWHRWQSFEEIFDPVLTEFGRRYPTKPIIIAEFGCAVGTPQQRASWIRDAHASLLKGDRVKAAIWFNFDKRREGERNWRIDATPGALAAFNETFAAPQPEISSTDDR